MVAREQNSTKLICGLVDECPECGFPFRNATNAFHGSDGMLHTIGELTRAGKTIAEIVHLANAMAEFQSEMQAIWKEIDTKEGS